MAAVNKSCEKELWAKFANKSCEWEFLTKVVMKSFKLKLQTNVMNKRWVKKKLWTKSCEHKLWTVSVNKGLEQKLWTSVVNKSYKQKLRTKDVVTTVTTFLTIFTNKKFKVILFDPSLPSLRQWKTKKNVKRMSEIVATNTNVVASRPPKCQPSGTPTARAKISNKFFECKMRKNCE